MADLMTECNYLNPDVEVIAEVNTPERFSTFAETLNTGHGLLGTTHADDVETLVNRVIEQGIPAYLLREIDLLVFPRRVSDERYVGEVVEFVDEPVHDAPGRSGGTIRKDGATIHYAQLCWGDDDGEYAFADDWADGSRQITAFQRLADARDESVADVRERFQRRHRYVRYLVREGITDVDELFGLLADLETDEAATVERLRHRADGGDEEGADGGY